MASISARKAAGSGLVMTDSFRAWDAHPNAGSAWWRPKEKAAEAVFPVCLQHPSLDELGFPHARLALGLVDLVQLRTRREHAHLHFLPNVVDLAGQHIDGDGGVLLGLGRDRVRPRLQVLLDVGLGRGDRKSVV